MTAPDSPSIQSIWATGGFVIMVYKVIGGTGAGTIISKGPGGGTGGWLIFSYLNGATYRLLLYHKALTTDADTWIANAASANQIHVVTVAWNASTPATPAVITLDGVTCTYNSTQAPVGALGTDVGQPLQLFNDQVIGANNEALNGEIYETMFWKSIPSAPDQATLIANIKSYYSIP
jgi:hypothetical protein